MSGFFYDMIAYDPANWDLDCAISYALDEYPNEFEDFWGVRAEFFPKHLKDDIDADTWEEYKRLYELSGRLAAAAKALIRPRKLPDSALRTPMRLSQEAEREEREALEVLERLKGPLLEELQRQVPWLIEFLKEGGLDSARSKDRFLFMCMQLHAGEIFLNVTRSYPGAMATKMLGLLDYLVEQPSLRTQQYLSRVAECYIRDMRAEFAVMTRAVLGAALEDVLPEDNVRQILHIPKHERVGLSAFIRAGDMTGVLDDRTRQACERIKTAGDDAIHVHPELAAEPDRLLEDLVAVLRHLERLNQNKR